MTMSLNPSSPSASSFPEAELDASLFDELIYTIFQAPREPESGGVVIAISSANPGEGSTFVSRALLRELGRSQMSSVAGVNLSFLRKLHEPTLEAIRSSLRASQDETSSNDRSITRRQRRALLEGTGRGPWEGSWQYRRDCIDLLRSEFDYSIIDCPSISASGDLLSIARYVDGVLLVVEANRTRREDPAVAEQRIAAAGGVLLGVILNKHKLEVPAWIDRLL